MHVVKFQTSKQVKDFGLYTCIKSATRKAVVVIGCRCFYCGGKAQHADHIVPTSLGGRDVAENMIASCASCNCSKNDKRLSFEIENEALTRAFIAAPLIREMAKSMVVNSTYKDGFGLEYQ